MYIFYYELRSLKKTIVVKSLLAFTMLLTFTLAYLLLRSNYDSISSTLSKIDDSLLLSLGINLDHFFTPLGFYSFVFVFITVVSAFFGASLGMHMITKEYIQGTVSFLLTKPIPRRQILKQKNFAALVALGIYHIIFQILSIIIFLILDDFSSIGTLILINFALLLVQICFLYISLIIASYVKKPKVANLIGATTIVVFIGLLIIEGLFNLGFLRFINPLSFFNASVILENGHIDFGLLLNVLFIIVFGINFAYGAYENDDV